MTTETPAFHVLALSGGGYRGLYTATVLAELESKMGRPIASHFDLICGTSIGGILALGLAAEIPAKQLKELFIKDGKRIFAERSIFRRIIKNLGFRAIFAERSIFHQIKKIRVRAKHDSKGLRVVLAEQFGPKTIGELKHRVLIPAVNCTTGKGQFFKTPHHRSFEHDYQMRILDVALATSAAPTYFPMSRNDSGVFADGGLVGNAPGLFGLHEVKTFLTPPDVIPKVRMLSIGTMTIGTSVLGNDCLDKGIIRWGSGLFDLIISAQESSVNYMLRHSLKHDYFQIDDTATHAQAKAVMELDQVSDAATTTLMDMGLEAAKRALGDPLFQPFRDYSAPNAVFYHGPNKNDVPEATC
ncbi:MAG: patatin-like phospholipase family protein [Azoarcus sp.]|jgi:hypothetical protein|nr:patatin-like phospholipase family protein [Azoarcus sp.]